MVLQKNIREKRLDEINEKFSWMNAFAIILAVYLVLLFFRMFVYAPVQVVGRSMMPTLKSGDMLFADKTAAIRRGDVIVFSDESKDKSYIKRVIGIAGDEIMIKGGVVYRSENGGDFYPLEEEYISSPTTIAGSLEKTVYSVPAGRLFVLGDNRINSSDSRYSTIGMPKTSSVLGVVPEWVINSKDNFLTKLLTYIL